MTALMVRGIIGSVGVTMMRITRAIVLIMALTAIGACAAAEIYPTTLIVERVNRETDIVTLGDTYGHTWTYRGVEEWSEGDVASAIMDDRGTPEISDDVIVSLRYCSLDIRNASPKIEGVKC